MHIVFCADPLQPHRVDFMYEAEANIASTLGID